MNHKNYKNNRIKNFNIDYFPPTKEMEIYLTLSKFFMGNISKKILLEFFFPILLVAYVGLLIISRVLFPNDYMITSNTISDLGNPNLNPIGWLFFSLSFMQLSILLIPFYQYVYKKMRLISPHLSKVSLIFNFISSAGFVMLSLVPNTPDKISVHEIAAMLSFGGMIFAGLLYWVSLFKAIIRHNGNHIILLFGIIIITVSAIIVSELVDWNTLKIKEQNENPSAEWYQDIAFWEWLLFFIMTAQTTFFFLMDPRWVYSHRIIKYQKHDVKVIIANKNERVIRKLNKLNENMENIYLLLL
ncbi:MAG: DUF998 domain-containing protein [Promethearchaeota archaeon]